MMKFIRLWKEVNFDYALMFHCPRLYCWRNKHFCRECGGFMWNYDCKKCGPF